MIEELRQSNWENTAAVIGGKGAWGKITDEHLRSLGFDTIISDNTGDKEETLNSNILAIRRSRIVCFSIWPDSANQINQIITTAVERGAVTAGQIVLENSSVKDPIIGSLRMLDSLGVSVCSTHPLVDPMQSPIEGQNIWIMEVGRNSLEARCFAEKLFESMRMVIHNLCLDIHDEDMDLMQGSVHLRKRAEDLTFWQMGIDLSSLNDKGTANFRLDEDSRRRTRNQDPQMSVALIVSMLRHNRGREFIHTLRENLQMLERLIDEDPGEAVRIINESADFLKGGV